VSRHQKLGTVERPPKPPALRVAALLRRSASAEESRPQRIVILALLGLALLATTAAAAEPDVVRVSVYKPAALPCGPYDVAEARGYFEQENLRFKPVYVQNGPQVAQHMAAGDLDLGCAAITVWLIGKSKNVDVSLLLSTAKGNAPVVVKPQIGSVKELDGKRCGTPGLGTIHDDNLRAFARQQGIAIQHVHGVGMASVVAMFDKGEIDCMTGWEPLMSAAVHRGNAKVLVDFTRPDGMESIEFAAMRKFVQEKPDVVYRFVRGLLKGSQFIKAKPDEAATILAKNVGFDKAILVAAMKRAILTEPYIDLAGSRVALDDALAGGKITRQAVTDPDGMIRGLVDHRFLQKAEQALRAEGWKP
jgi:NitT/TauT family transport system substrate-binding protein